MAETIKWDHTQQMAGDAVRFSKYGPDGKSLIVECYPGRERQNRPCSPEIHCDRIVVFVGQRAANDIPTHDHLGTYEIPVTQPPRDRAAFEDLAQHVGLLASSTAEAIFALSAPLT